MWAWSCVFYGLDRAAPFFGEEPYQLARVWTRGYDVFAPSAAPAFHQWARGARAASYQSDGRVRGRVRLLRAHARACSRLGALCFRLARGRRAGARLARAWGAWSRVRQHQSSAAAARGTPAQVVEAARAAAQRRVLYVLGAASSPGEAGAVAAPAGAEAEAEGEPAGLATAAAAEVPSAGGRRGANGHLGPLPPADDAAAWRPGGVWGLGLARSLQDLERHCGTPLARRAPR